MGVLSALYAISIGGAALQLRECKYSETPVVDETSGRTETHVTLAGKGWIEATTEAGLATALQQATDSFRTGGQDVIVTGLGGVRVLSILAAQCLHGGPDVEFEISDADEPAKRDVDFTITAAWGVDPSRATDVFQVRIDTRPDGLRVVTRSGKIVGPGAQSYFYGTTLPEVQGTFPATQWVMTQQSGADPTYADRVTYQVRLEELSEPLPSSIILQVLDGTAETRVDRDAQARKTTTYSYDLLIRGDPYAMQTLLRPTGTIQRESMSFSRFKGTRVRVEFVKLEGGDGSDLLDWQQEWEFEDDLAPHRSVTWPGVDPAIVFADKPTRRGTQRGYAIGAGRYVQAADPLFPDNLEAPGRVSHQAIDLVERRTTWEYTFLFLPDDDLLSGIPDQLGRPAQPTFLDDDQGGQ